MKWSANTAEDLPSFRGNVLIVALEGEKALQN